MTGLWWRWTWRDFRSRWIQILATSLILAVGVGAFAGLGGLRQWRERSAELSLRSMRAHDVRIDLAAGAWVPEGALRGAVARLPSGTVAAAEERAVADAQVEAPGKNGPVLVPARIVGMPVPASGNTVDALAVRDGHGLGPGDARRAVAVVDWNFAHHYGLADHGTLRLTGLGPVPYVGQAVSPQHLLISDAAGMSGAESSLAVLYLPMGAAQRVVGRPSRVDELVVRIAPGADRASAARAVTGALRRVAPGGAVTVTRLEDEAAHRMLFRDARNDQKLYTVFAVLLLAGAAFAAFNLVSRVVEAQRREIGVGMALGVEPRLLARRPLALGAQIAVLGVVLGVPVGLGLSALIRSLLLDFFPLPVSAHTFPARLYVAGAALGVVLPLLAAALPVRRAVRVAPIDAIRTGPRAGAGGGAAAALRHLRARPLVQLPIRNLARRPRRTLLTLLGLGAVMTAVVGVLGMVDAIRDVSDRQQADVLSTNAGRLRVTLRGERPEIDPVVRRVMGTPGVAAAEPGLIVPARVGADGRTIDVGVAFSDPRSRIWRPRTEDGAFGASGIVLARKAAEDLRVGVGDRVTVVHPAAARGTFVLRADRVRVAGVNANPIRAVAQMPLGERARLGLGGVVNTVTVVPRAGASRVALQRALVAVPGVASVQRVAAETESLKAALDSFGSSIDLVASITLALALLVAFTSTSVSLDERRREYATMFAFGLPVRTGLRVAMTESLITGLLGTLVGVGLGLLVIRWTVRSLMTNAFPDIGAQPVLEGASVATVLLVGIVAVTVAPLLTARRMRRMDLPSTLRVVE